MGQDLALTNIQNFARKGQFPAGHGSLNLETNGHFFYKYFKSLKKHTVQHIFLIQNSIFRIQTNQPCFFSLYSAIKSAIHQGQILILCFWGFFLTFSISSRGQKSPPSPVSNSREEEIIWLKTRSEALEAGSQQHMFFFLEMLLSCGWDEKETKVT